MNFKITRILLASTILLAHFSAQATDAIYLNLDTGWAKQSGLPSITDAQATQLKHGTFPSAWHVDIGYNHDFRQWFGAGLEINGAQYGKATYTQAGGNTQVVTESYAFLIATMFHFDRFSLIAKAGLAHTGAKNTGLNKYKKSKNRAEAALAYAYPLSKHFAVQGTYVHIFGKDNHRLPVLFSPSINALIGGIRVTF